MKIGIVGHEAAKFTVEAEVEARLVIRELLAPLDATLVSGHCHLGGIDIWAEQLADGMGRNKLIHAPAFLSWEKGYKPRNEAIARDSDVVHVIVVDKLPRGFRGPPFPYCYHCKTDAHVKSGGCWTAKRAQRSGKPAHWHVIHQSGDAPAGPPQ